MLVLGWWTIHRLLLESPKQAEAKRLHDFIVQHLLNATGRRHGDVQPSIAAAPVQRQAGRNTVRSGFNLEFIDDDSHVVTPIAKVVSAPTPIGSAVTAIWDDKVPTMSSREITDLTGKRHKDVLYDIRKMLCELGKAAADFSATAFIEGPNNSKRGVEIFNLPKRETLILVSGYNLTMRAKIIDRWQELEQQVAHPQFAIPQTLPDALRLAASLAEEKAAAVAMLAVSDGKLAIAAPKAEALDRISDSKGMFNLRVAAKLLKQNPLKFNAWLRDELGWPTHQLAILPSGLLLLPPIPWRRWLSLLPYPASGRPRLIFDISIGCAI